MRSKTSSAIRLLPMLLVALGCHSTPPSEGEAPPARRIPHRLSLEVGGTAALQGDLVDDADPSLPSITLTSVQALSGHLDWQVQLSYLTVKEKEDDVILAGGFGSYRQDTESYGLTIGPRLSWGASEGAERTEAADAAEGVGGGSIFGAFLDAGFGVYLTHITGRFPRGKNGHTYDDWSEDLGASVGTGLALHFSESMFLGLSFRYHLIFLRFRKGERWFDSNDPDDARIARAIRFGEEGGRSDDLGFLTGALTFGWRF